MRADKRAVQTTSGSNHGVAPTEAEPPSGRIPGSGSGSRVLRSPRTRRAPFRTPDSRWQLAEEASQRQPSGKLEPIVKLAAEWLARTRTDGSRGRLPNRLKTIDEAARLRDDAALLDRIRLLAVADAPVEVAAETLGVSSRTIQVFEALHFDVRDDLDARDYLFLRVLNPLTDGRDDDYGLRLRLALGGGPDAAVVLLDATLPKEAALAFKEREQTLAMSWAATGAKRCDEEPRAAYVALAREYRTESDRLRGESGATTPAAEQESLASADVASSPPVAALGSEDSGTIGALHAAPPAQVDVASDPADAATRRVRTSESRPERTSSAPLENSSSARKRAIYERVCRLAAPFRFGELWAWVEPSRGIYGGFADPPAILAELQKDFGDDAAVAAGAAERDSGGTLRLAVAISDPHRPFLAIYDSQGDVVDLLTEQGCLSGEEIPVLVELGAHVDDDVEPHSQGEESIGDDEEEDEDEEYDPSSDLLVSFTIEDAACLRACGFRATTAYGLDGLSPSQAERLAELMGWPRFGGARSSRRGETLRSRFRSLTFVGWSPATFGLETPTDLARVERSFRELGTLMEILPDGVHVWRPIAEAIDRANYFAKYRDAARLFRGLRASAFNDIRGSSGVSDEPTPNAKSPAGLEEAVRLHILPLSSDAKELLEQSGDSYAYRVTQQIVMQLIRRASEESDPAEAARMLQEALLIQRTLMQGGHAARLGCIALARPSRERIQEADEATELFLKLCSQLEKGRRKDEPCRKRTTIEGVARRAHPKRIPGAGSSDSD